MSHPIRYATIPLAESSACEAAFEQLEIAWQSGDAELIGQALGSFGSLAAMLAVAFGSRIS